MADPLRFTIVCRARRPLIAAIRGYFSELNDPTPGATGVLTDADQPTPLAHLRGDGFQKPSAISGPIPAIGGERLVAWGGWLFMLSDAQRTDIMARVASRGAMVRYYEQNAAETDVAYEARWKADCLWVNPVRTT